MSLPLLMGDSPRLYLAEPICAVLEIKSDICRQWDQVLETARKVRSLRRSSACLISGMGEGLPEHIPFFAIGYEGWKASAAVIDNLKPHGTETDSYVDGVLVINPGIYAGRGPLALDEGYSAHNFEGERAIFGLLLSLEQIMSNMILMKPPYMAYVAD